MARLLTPEYQEVQDPGAQKHQHSVSSPPDEVVSSTLSLMLDDLKVFQEFFVHIADTLESETLVISEKSHKLLNIMSASGPTRIALPISKGLLDLASSLWQMPPIIPPMS